MTLRPIRNENNKPLRAASDRTQRRGYGWLIAEEMDKVYPELVIRVEKGDILGARYDELAPRLLNEVQHQEARLQNMRLDAAQYCALETAVFFGEFPDDR